MFNPHLIDPYRYMTVFYDLHNGFLIDLCKKKVFIIKVRVKENSPA